MFSSRNERRDVLYNWFFPHPQPYLKPADVNCSRFTGQMRIWDLIAFMTLVRPSSPVGSGTYSSPIRARVYLLRYPAMTHP